MPGKVRAGIGSVLLSVALVDSGQRKPDRPMVTIEHYSCYAASASYLKFSVIILCAFAMFEINFYVVGHSL